MDSGVNEVTVQKENKKRNKKFPPPTFKQKKRLQSGLKASAKSSTVRGVWDQWLRQALNKERVKKERERGREREGERERKKGSPPPLPLSLHLLLC